MDNRRIIEALKASGLLRAGEPVKVTPLAGGVSCDVMKVETGGGRAFTVKQSLPKLRVAVEWLAPVERAESEARWLRLARRVDPRLAPEVLAEAPAEHLFAMTFFDPADHPVWKDELVAGRVDVAFAGAVGRDLARIHAATAGREDIAAQFRTEALFMALRVDPFLLYVADRNPDAAPRLRGLAEGLRRSRIALVHGDVSPKNILAGPQGPVFLDAECAVYGDPAFDLAFCLTHLLLKTVWLHDHAAPLMAAFDALSSHYIDGVDWEAADSVAGRAAALVAALLLARVDGKSPAAYLDKPGRDLVRRRALQLLARTPPHLDELGSAWRSMNIAA